MKYSLTLVKKHESISELPSGAELGDFTLLTGLNGSGKTHLLQAIDNGCIEVKTNGSLILADEILLLDWSTLNAGTSPPADVSALLAQNRQLWAIFEAAVYNPTFATNLRSFLGAASKVPLDVEVLKLNKVAFFQLLNAPSSQSAEGEWQKFNTKRASFRTSALRNLESSHPRVAAILSLAEVKYDSEDRDITKSEFLSVANSSSAAQEPFRQNLSELFALYGKLFNDNVLNRARSREYGEDLQFVSDEEFYVEHGQPPWDFLNGLLENEGYDFQVTSPGAIADEPFVARLIHRVQRVEIDFSALSSGERVLVALAICVYNTEDDRIKVNYPKLMLFDEVDAPLHPSMIRSLLRIFKEVLVEKNNIGVVLTTHSPTTVAVADGPEILQMNAEMPRFEKTTAAAAIQMLTEGVTALSVKVEARRAVFVESNNDVEYFEKLEKYLVGKVSGAFSPTYMSTGFKTRTGDQIHEGKSRVKVMTAALVAAGAEVFGLCDGDNEAASGSSSVLLLGDSSRYSIENFLWDPLFIAGAALNGDWNKVLNRADFSLAASDKFGDLDTSKEDTLQRVINHVLQVVGPPNSTVDETPRSIQLVGGQSVEMPEWFLTERGHDWQKRVVKKIPQFQDYGRTEHQQTTKMLSEVVRYNVGLLDVMLLRSIEALHS